MNLALGLNELKFYIDGLISYNFPLLKPFSSIPASAHTQALDRIEYCFNRIRRKYYHNGDAPCFDPLNSDHLAIYLWFLSNTLATQLSIEDLAIAVSHLNKRLHGLDLFYSVKMPDIFLLVHPVGSVFGAASYSDYFVGYQNCTVGSDGISYPSFGEGVICYSKTSILGACSIGSNVVFAANTFVLNSDIPSDSIVTGSYPSNRIIHNSLSVQSRIFTPSHP